MYVLSLNRILLNIGWKRCAESCLFWLRGLPKERAVKGHLCAWLTHSQNGVYGKLEIEQRGTGPTQSTAVRLGACKCPISKSKSRIMGETLKLVYVQIFFTKWLYILYSGIYPLMNSKKFSNSKKKQWDPHLHADTYPLWLHTSKMQEEQNTAVHILHTEICNFSPSLTHTADTVLPTFPWLLWESAWRGGSRLESAFSPCSCMLAICGAHPAAAEASGEGSKQQSARIHPTQERE